jgi:hypothetical protein
MRGALIVSAFVLGLFVVGCAAEPGVVGSEAELRQDCSLVRCPMPLCAQGQHLVYGGSCCPHCEGPQSASRCADVACPMMLCAIGEELVSAPGQCCPSCRPAHHVAECATTADCPVFECFACPCPTSECRGHQCVTQTPDASTCMNGI